MHSHPDCCFTSIVRAYAKCRCGTDATLIKEEITPLLNETLRAQSIGLRGQEFELSANHIEAAQSGTGKENAIAPKFFGLQEDRDTIADTEWARCPIHGEISNQGTVLR